MRLNPLTTERPADGRATAARSRGQVTAAAVALAVAITGTVALGAPALAAQDTLPGKAAVPASAIRTVTLVTGDQVTITSTATGQRVLAVHPASHSRGSSGFLSFQDAAGDRYVIPAMAQP